jgi:small neutral amino acid transporter SnatA (MarC family)
MSPNELKNQQTAVWLGWGSVALFVFACCFSAICVVRWSGNVGSLDYALLTLIFAVASTFFGLVGIFVGVLGWRRTKQKRSVVCTVGVIANILVITALWLWVAFLPY